MIVAFYNSEDVDTHLYLDFNCMIVLCWTTGEAPTPRCMWSPRTACLKCAVAYVALPKATDFVNPPCMPTCNRF
jgi:hypothetical protein